VGRINQVTLVLGGVFLFVVVDAVDERLRLGAHSRGPPGTGMSWTQMIVAIVVVY
jgi:hypothetical protein